MRRHNPIMLALVLLVGAGIGGCSGTSDNKPGTSNPSGMTCRPGTTALCGCSDLTAPMITCSPSGTYPACPCVTGPGAGGGGGAGNAGANSAGAYTAGGASGTGGTSGGGGSGGATPPGTGGGGAGGASGAGAGGGGGSSGSSGSAVPKIPTVTGALPTLPSGDDKVIKVLGQDVHLWVGTKKADKKGTVFFYWHGTGSHYDEAKNGLGGALAEITADGGVVASFEGTTAQGQTVNNNVWYTGDYAMADIILAAAVQQLNIDTTRIYAGGCSAGGLASGTMAYLRSSYLAGAMPNSGGIVQPFVLENPAHVPSVMTTHGSFNADFVAPAHFQTTSLDECNDLSSMGGFEVDCEHSAGHCQAPSEVTAAQWTFLKAHPFGVKPDPYAGGLPANFPPYCKIIKSTATSQLACHTTAECSAQTCCFTPGPNGSTVSGTKSSCMAPGAQNGASGRCPTGQFQLCAATSECSGGQTCTAATNGYCH